MARMGEVNDDGRLLIVRTRLESVGPATAIELSDAQVADLGGGSRAAVIVRVGERTARLRLARMGGANLIGLSKAARVELAVDIGDEIEATIAVDHAPRHVRVPEALASVLDAEGLRPAFEAWSYSRRKEAARAVAAAKRPETVTRRVDGVVAALRQA